ncbi:MAG: AMP-binding protein [Pseudomonadota bacterium]
MNAVGPFLEALRRDPEGIAVIDADGRGMSRRALLARVVGLSRRLQERGVVPGEPVVLQIPAGAAFCVSTLAVIAAGGVPALIEPGLGEEVYLSRVRACGARWTLVHPLVARLQRTPGALSLLGRLELHVPPRLRDHGMETVTVDARVLARLARTAPQGFEPVDRDPRDDGALVFTGGTTAAPMGVRLSHAALGSYITHISEAIGTLKVERFLAETPQQLLYAIRLGKTAYASRGRKVRRARHALKLIREGAVDACFGSPYLWTEMMRLGGKGATRFPPTLKTVLLGGAPVTPPFLEQLLPNLDPGTRVVALYGMTEAGPVCMATAGEKLAFRGEGDLVGAPLGEIGVDVPEPGPDGVGEVVVRGPSLFSGYLGEAAREPGEPFPTGDLGRLVPRGRHRELVLVGRKKDMIIRNGVNLYPASFEALIAGIVGATGRPLVRECAMVGVWNAERQDEDVALFVVPAEPGAFDPDLFERKTTGILGADARPDHLRVVERLPVTGRLDKTDKQALQRMLSEETAPVSLPGMVVPFHWSRFLRKQLLQVRQLGLKAAAPAAASRLGLLALLQTGWALDELLTPRWRAAGFSGPLFVIGHQRSGTTLLHRLLARDPRVRTMKLHEMLLPATSAQRALGGVVGLDALLGGSLGRWFSRAQERKLGPMDPIHRIRLDEVEEDEFVLWTVYASAMCVNDSPISTGDSRLDEVRDFHAWEPAEQVRTLAWYRACITKKAHREPTADGSPPLAVSKNPAFSQKIPQLLKTFPDAMFVSLVRNPVETIPSRLSLVREIWRRRFPGFEDMRAEQVETILADSFRTYLFTERDLADVPAGRKLILTYDEFAASPGRAVTGIYRHFDLPGPPPELEDELGRLDGAQQARTSGHRYSLSEFGLTEDRIRAALAPVFGKYRF